MHDEIERAIAELAAFGAAVVESGLLASTCGNVSLKVGEDRMVISASGSEIGRLDAGSVCVVALDTGGALRGPKPSMEAGMHRRVYQVRAGATAVVHCQSQHATLLACLKDPPTNLDLIPEVPAYVRAHAHVPYAQPGSDALADLVAGAFADPEVTIVQMRNHGQVILGGTWRRAVRRGVFFEMACSIAACGRPLHTIPAADAAALRDYARDV